MLIMEADRLVRLDGKWNPVLNLKPAVAGQERKFAPA